MQLGVENSAVWELMALLRACQIVKIDSDFKRLKQASTLCLLFLQEKTDTEWEHELQIPQLMITQLVNSCCDFHFEVKGDPLNMFT